LFEEIVGVDLSTSPLSKTRLLANLLERSHADKSSSVMVGDTISDVKAAQENKIDSVGVTFGFGTFEDPYMPTYLCHSVDELARLLK
jgi:phosphoglycolate phosphatase